MGSGPNVMTGLAATEWGLVAISNLWLGAGNAPKLKLQANTAEPVYERQNGIDYAVALDAGALANTPPIGAIIFAQAVGVTGAALSPGGYIPLGGGVSLSWQAYSGGSGSSIVNGYWRNIGAQTAGGAGLWCRVA